MDHYYGMKTIAWNFSSCTDNFFWMINRNGISRINERAVNYIYHPLIMSSWNLRNDLLEKK